MCVCSCQIYVGCLSQFFSLLFFETASLAEPRAHWLAYWLLNQLERCMSLPPQCWRYKCLVLCLALYVDACSLMLEQYQLGHCPRPLYVFDCCVDLDWWLHRYCWWGPSSFQSSTGLSSLCWCYSAIPHTRKTRTCFSDFTGMNVGLFFPWSRGWAGLLYPRLALILVSSWG